MASSSMSTTYPYPVGVNVKDYVHDVLSGSNYQQWKQQMENLLRETGMVGFIDGTTKAPARKVIVYGREIENEEYKSWKKSNDLVMTWIRTTITEGINKEVKRVRTAKGLWTRFENWYGMPGIDTSSMASPSSNITPAAAVVSASAVADVSTPTPTVASTPILASAPALAVSPAAAAVVSTPTLTTAAVSGTAAAAVSAPAAAAAVSATVAAAVSATIAAAVSGTAAAAVSAPAAAVSATVAAAVSATIAATVSAPTAAAAVISTPTPTAAAVSAPTAASVIANRFLPLHKAAIEGKWDEASKFIEKESDAVRVGITEYSETALIVAVKSKKRNHFVKHLLKKMSEKDVALGDTRKRTALHRAAGANNTEIAKLLVGMNPCLPNAQTNDKRIPLFFAAARGHRKMVLYLLNVTRDEARPMSSTTSLSQLLSANGFSPRSKNQTPIGSDDGTKMGIEKYSWNPTPFDGESGFRILHQLTINGFYDIALALLQDKPQMAHFIPAPRKTQDDSDFHSLLALARKPSSFPSGTSFNWFQRFICWVLEKLEKNADHQSAGDIENPAGCFTSSGGYAKKILHWMIWKITYLCKHVEEQKRLHDQACKLVQFLCNELANSNDSNVHKIFQLALFQATSLGIVEIVEAILRSYPDAIYIHNENEQSIFHQAIVCRHEKVFNLIHKVGESKTIFLSQLDKTKNNALHLAGKLAPQQQLYRKAGAALQMQRELQWFKEVEKHVVPRSKEERNDKNKTPAEVFTDTHKNLVKEGERWMKDTANGCIIAATLIATVVFAAAITVPGGNNSDGNPLFYKQAWFIIFGISDAFALFSSITSVLFFMSILTARYGEHDFLVTLPVTLIFGLLTLFLCILSTMIAFGATLYLVFGRERHKAWIIIPIPVFACMPVALFVSLKLPLLADMIKSTSRSIFVKQKDDAMLH